MKRSVVAGVGALALAAGAVGVLDGRAEATPASATPKAAATTGDTAGHGFGLDLTASRAQGSVSAPKGFGAMAAPAMRAATAVPEAADLSPKALAPGNQGRVGSCVTWATGYTGYGILMNEQGITGGPMAPMYIYAQISRGYDQGTWAGRALPMMVEQGIDTRDHYGPGDFDFWTQPTQAERANAAKYKLTGYQQLPTSGQAAVNAIKTAIANGSPVPFGIQLRQNFNNMSASLASSYSYRPSGYVIGGHEMTIIGYNAKGVKVMNSWGAQWGDRGTYTMPWDFVNWGDVTEMHAMGKVAGGNPIPTPTPDPTPNPTPTPDPTPAPGPTNNVLVNGDFEDGGTGWPGNVAAVVTESQNPTHGGNGKLWLGGNGRVSTQYVGQRVTIPANGKLSFWVRVVSQDVDNADYSDIDLVDDNNRGETVSHITSSEATDGYVQKTVDVSKFAGRTMWLRLSSSEDNGGMSSFFYDDISLG